MDLSSYDGKRIAIVLNLADVHRVIRGLASYIDISEAAGVMRIQPEEKSAGNPEFVIDEQKWDGNIVPDDMYGCDYRLRLSA